LLAELAMIVRLSKIALVLAVGLFGLLVGGDNVIDYATNYAFVTHVMDMDSVFPDSTMTWRAVTSPVLHEIAYAGIIAAELLSGALCVAGAARLWKVRAELAQDFNTAKGLAVAGLALGFVLWFGGFLVVGGEWFQMWQSNAWNGQEAAFRFIVCIGLVLVFLNQRDDELA
jgi:predicted small integral membrane protein